MPVFHLGKDLKMLDLFPNNMFLWAVAGLSLNQLHQDTLLWYLHLSLAFWEPFISLLIDIKCVQFHLPGFGLWDHWLSSETVKCRLENGDEHKNMATFSLRACYKVQEGSNHFWSRRWHLHPAPAKEMPFRTFFPAKLFLGVWLLGQSMLPLHQIFTEAVLVWDCPEKGNQ